MSIVSYPQQTRNSRTALIYDIPGLEPLETRNVEGLPPVRSGQNIPLTNEQWFDWVPRVKEHRLRVFAEGHDPGPNRSKAREREIERIRSDERYWFYSYPAIFEVREDESESIVFETEEEVEQATYRSGMMPYILYPFQDYYITWQKNALRTRGAKGDTLVIKSRDMGMSNTAMGMLSWRWLTRSQRYGHIFQGRVLSRVEELVDASGDPDSLMWKMDLMLRSTPRWILEHFQPGFNWEEHRRLMVLEAPLGANLIKGESTNATAGRGKRATIILLDEFPFMAGFRAIWQATRPSTYHRIAVGSVSTQKGLDAYVLFRSGVPAIIVMDSRRGMHPMQDKQWHGWEKERSVFEGEYEQEQGMDWFADSTDLVYPEASKKDFGDFGYVPFGGPVFCTMDDGNHWAMWFLQYIRNTGRIHLIDSYRNQGQRVAFYGALMRGQMLHGFDYGPDERRILHLLSYMPVDVFTGDTHGDHREQIAGHSVIDDLAMNWGIHVNIDYMRREYVDRQKAFADLIPHMDVNDTPGNRVGWANVQQYSYPPTPPGKEKSREPRNPLHNDLSHDPTSIEFWATQFNALKSMYGGTRIVWVGQPAA